MTRQIGWYHLKEDTVFTNYFECAAWHENVLVKAGRYPIEVHNYHVYSDKEVTGDIYIPMEGIIKDDYFGALFCGMPIGHYDSDQNVGKEGYHHSRPYLFDIAKSIAEGDDTYELFPEYEARMVEFKSCYDGEIKNRGHIFEKQEVDHV